MKLSITILLAMLALTLLIPQAIAEKGGKGKGGNGFPPGTHFNLNVIAKWSERDSGNFTCPSAEEYSKYEDSITGESCDPLEGSETCMEVPNNVIFIPRESSDNQHIDVISGGKGKKATDIIDMEQLQVTNWCTEKFDNDPAAFFLPENKNGYGVFARLTGKPKKNGTASMTLIPDIESVETECVVLVDDGEGGLIPDPEGTTEPCDLLHIGNLSSDGIEISRSGDGSSEGTIKGKGVNKAVEVTDLFMFTGHVCLRPEPNFYFDNGVVAPEDFCLDEGGVYVCNDVSICCSADTDNNGQFDSCGYLEGGSDQAIDESFDPTTEPWADPTAGNALTTGEFGVCLIVGDTEYTVPCQGPYVNEWSFNIADVVNYFLDVNNNGGYVLQLRFYPNP